MTTKLFIHAIAGSQLDGSAIGTIVRPLPEDNEDRIVGFVHTAASEFDFPASGVGVIDLPEEACHLVYCGDAPMPPVLDDEMFQARVHRGEAVVVRDRSDLSDLDLAPAEVRVVVYTVEAYIGDPQTTDIERAYLTEHGYTHVLVTILASNGPKPTVSSHRFTRNLGGGNSRYASPRDLLGEGAVKALIVTHNGHEDEFFQLELLQLAWAKLLGEAKAVVDYEEKWITVG